MSKLRLVVLTAALAAALAAPMGALVAGPLRGHPNLRAARTATDNAWERIAVAQRDNEFDMDGHAEKAKEALKIAVDELRLAAEIADRKER
jgi:hypothetical protein